MVPGDPMPPLFSTNLNQNTISMNKVLSIIIFSCLFFSLAKAQSPQIEVDSVYVYEYEPVKNVLRLSPFHFIEGTFHLSYERFFGESNSIVISGGMTSRQRWFQEEPDFGFQEEFQYRRYFIPPSNVGSNGKNFFFFKGLYAGPYFTHRFRQQSVQEWDWVTQQNVNVYQNINEYAGGVLLGVQMAFGNVLFMDIFTGGGIKRSVGNNTNSTFINTPFDVGYNGVYPKAGFQIGVGF